ncbi:MAG: type IX secretion system membrane protein PorP/SprF [Bacteroidia bacterium]|nr:type IX secretion system membrane protein PorP/SprF [Bacteroidia bacterium]
MRRLLPFIIVILVSLQAFGQQDPQYSMYMFNGQVLNPAYAGSRENVSTTLLMRWQWVGFDGAPATQSFSINGPSRNLHHGFGLSFFNDKIGQTRNSAINVDYAFRILMGENSALSLGLRGTVANLSRDLTSIDPSGGTDGNFSQNVNLWQPNVGTGIYFNSRRLYLGASVPHLIENKWHADPNVNPAASGVYSRHFLFTAGIVLGGDAVKFKPSALLKIVPNAPMSLDLNGAFLFADKLWIGGSWRMNDAVVGMLEWQVSKAFRLGYAYDYGISDLKPAHNGSHELMLGFDFNFKGNSMVSPRYF